MKKLLPVILALVGLAIGTGAGVFLAPSPEPVEKTESSCPDGEHCEDKPKDLPAPEKKSAEYNPDQEWDYVKLPKQFVVPVIKKDRVRALVVLSLSLEVEVGQSDAVLAKVPKLRDGFLQVLFDHANSGGFDGAFTTGRSMSDLRGELFEVAQFMAGETVAAVLIDEIVKQSM